MKLMKKISAVLLSLCLLVPCFSMVAFAADGRISFTDPSTAVGEYVEVRCVLRSTSGNMGAVEVALTYDESYLKFDSGDGIEVSGSGALTCKGTASSAEASFVAKFQALQEGTTKVEVTGATIADANGISLTFAEETKVEFYPLSDKEIYDYIKNNQYTGKDIRKEHKQNVIDYKEIFKEDVNNIVERNSGYEIVPTYSEALWAMHRGTTRHLKCPKCNKRTWCKKIIK